MEGHPVHPVAHADAVGTSVDTAPSVAPASRPPSVELPARLTRRLRALVVLGGLGVLVGCFMDLDRTAANLLIGSHYILGLALGGLVFVAFGYVTGAGWHIVPRRTAEGMAGVVPMAGLATLLALLIGLMGSHPFYVWADAEVMAADHVLQGKAGWLNSAGVILRALIYLALWSGFAFLIRRVSLRQDRSGEVQGTHRNTVLSVLFLVTFALTFSLATFDWLMSLEPHWYSTVFAIYDFSGLFSSALAMLLVVLIALRRMGRLPELREGHLHDIAKLLIGFVTFWGYIWFCQYMLIWYANIGEETAWFSHRMQGGWSVLHVANPIINWLIPFLLLLPRPAKRSESLLLKVCALVLIGRWLDLYIVSGPLVMPGGPSLGPWELAPLLLLLPLYILFLFGVLGRHPLVPKGDPYLVESLHHDV